MSSANLEGSMRVKNDSKKYLISIVANISSEHIEYVAIEWLWAKEEEMKKQNTKKQAQMREMVKYETGTRIQDPRKRDKSEKKIKQYKKK